MPTDSRDNDAEESQQYQLRQAESDDGEGAKSPHEVHRTTSVSAVVRLLLGVLLMAAGLAFLGNADSKGELELGEIAFGLVGLALVAPGVVLLLGSLLGIKKTDEADSTTKKVAKGCVKTFLNLLAGLILLLILFFFAIPLLS